VLPLFITLLAVAKGGCLPPSALPPGVFHSYGLARGAGRQAIFADEQHKFIDVCVDYIDI